MKIIRKIAGVVIGYALMVVLITLAQEDLLGGISWNGSTIPVLILGGSLTCLAGVVGAFLATAIEGNAGRIASLVMGCLVVLETTVLILGDKLDGPLWFDVAAAASLIVAIFLGAELYLRLNRPAATSAPA